MPTPAVAAVSKLLILDANIGMLTQLLMCQVLMKEVRTATLGITCKYVHEAMEGCTSLQTGSIHEHVGAGEV